MASRRAARRCCCPPTSYTKESGWGVTLAYTYTNATQNRSITEHYAFDAETIQQYPFIDSNAAPKHRFVATGSIDGIWGITFASKLTLATPTTFNDIACYGATYPSGAGCEPRAALANLGRGAFLFGGKIFGYRDVDFQATKDFDLTRGMSLYVDSSLNAFNYKNYRLLGQLGGDGVLNPDPVQYNTEGTSPACRARSSCRWASGGEGDVKPALLHEWLHLDKARAAGFVFLTVCASGVAPAHAAPKFSELPKAQQKLVDDVEKRTFEFFRDSANAQKGLVPDHWPDDHVGDYFSSIAAVGFGLTAYGIGAERGWMSRSEAVKRTLATLRFFHAAPQGDANDVSGNHGFFYHFLDMQSGQRYHAQHWDELSTIDTTLLLGGVLFAQGYYDHSTRDERIRKLADDIYRRVDWQWARRAPRSWQWADAGPASSTRRHGYDEDAAMLALGSPTRDRCGAWKT